LPRLLSLEEVSRWLSIPVPRVRRLAKQRRIPCIILPGNESSDIVFDPSELAVWIESMRPNDRQGKNAAGRGDRPLRTARHAPGGAVSTTRGQENE
jgi:hypothetical protein